MEKKTYLISVLSAAQKWQFYGLLFLWLPSTIGFVIWWLQPEHVVDIWRFGVNTLIISWILFMPGYFFFFVSRMKKANPQLVLPDNWRVAMVVTKAPNEPWPIVQKTLEAMLTQKYPHDTWLADEQPTEETVVWCQHHRVKISSRFNVVEYHRSEWPRRTKCKEGNLTYFYDHYGYANYDLVAQLDADHIPAAKYLEAVLRPFLDPTVGYVSAPSICDLNQARSWVARGRLHAEATMHGPLQAGYTNGWAPLCIGSHYAIRTTALKQIGGLGPELAEDHSTTLLMQAHGWRGVHAIDAIAHGDGPLTLADCLTQEFQWSRSLMVLLLTLTPRCLSNLPARLKFQFLFSQIWYPLFGLIMLAAYSLPVVALLTKTPWMNVNYVDFITLSLPVTASSLVMLAWIRRQRLLRPVNAPMLSWESILFQLVRWPWILWGCWGGIQQVIRQRTTSFKVTPKGNITYQPFPAKLLLPYIWLILLPATVALSINQAQAAAGYFYFVILNCLIYCVVCFLIVSLHIHEQTYSWKS